MPLTDCEINFILTRSTHWFIIDHLVAKQIPTFALTDTNRYVPVVNFSSQDYAKLLEELKSGFMGYSFRIFIRY